MKIFKKPYLELISVELKDVLTMSIFDEDFEDDGTGGQSGGGKIRGSQGNSVDGNGLV